MKWSSVLSEKSDFEEAMEECCQKIEKEMTSPPDLSVLFISSYDTRLYHKVPEKIQKILNPKWLIGCSAGGVIGEGKEIEQKPAISLVCAQLPDVTIVPFHILNHSIPDMDTRPKSWQELVGVSAEAEPHFVLLSDPFSLDAERLLTGLDYAFPKSTKVGGLASGATEPGGNFLFLNNQVYQEGVVGIALSGNIVLDSVVAQGCRPIGTPLVITACQNNLLLELQEEPPLKILEQLAQTLPPRDQHLLRTSLFLGIVMHASKTSLSQGDFLIRNIIGADLENGVLSIGAELRRGQVVQFHLRDAQTSTKDLEMMLSHYSARKESKKSQVALLFSCAGRGVYLYGTPDHDTKLFQKKVGKIPVGGFFCNGEIGAVDRQTYIHGYTSCFGLFRPR